MHVSATILILVVLAVLAGYFVYRWAVARRSAGPSAMVETIDVEGESHRIPLPPHSLPGEEVAKIKEYFTTATMAELKDYLYRALPAAGWALGDKLSTAFFFYRGDRRLTIVIQPADLLRTRLRMTISKR